MIECPRCGTVAEKTGKQWKYGAWDVELLFCKSCEKSFKAYYKGREYSHTIPKQK